jgi:hypothetical protein
VTWLRRILPDLVIAAVVGLLATIAVHHLEKRESERVRAGLVAAGEQPAGHFLETLDLQIDVLESSIRRSTLVQLPLLVLASGGLVGLARPGRWRRAWIPGVLAAMPPMAMGVAFVIDVPAAAAGVVFGYVAIAVLSAVAAAWLRSRIPLTFLRTSPGTTTPD